MNKSVVLETREVRRRFLSGSRVLPVLGGIDLAVSPGEFLAVTGKSGAGKSTLLHIMGGLDRPDSGDVLLEGSSLQRLSRRALAQVRNQKIGFVFQFFHLLPEFSALENVMLPALIAGGNSRARSRAADLLDLVGLSERLGHYPAQLSGGEQQRVAVARALVNDPLVLLADEPTGNVDSHTSRLIMDLLRRINRELGQATVVVSHDSGVGEWADRSLRLRDGVLETGPGLE